MITKHVRVVLFTGISIICTLAAQPALAISTFETNATRDTASGTDSDPQGPATSGSLLSEVVVPDLDGANIGFSGPGYARGAANDLGRGAVDTNSLFFSGNQFNEITSVSISTSSVTNNTGGDAPFAYDFFLPGPRLTIADFAGLSASDDPTVTAVFDFSVSLDQGSGFVSFFTSTGELSGGIVGHVLTTGGTDPLASTAFGENTSVFGYQFDDLDRAISGSLAAGETVSVQSVLFVSVTAPGFETGGAARIGDPLDLSAGAFTGDLTIVPVPPAVWLFVSGIVGLIAIARRKSRS